MSDMKGESRYQRGDRIGGRYQVHKALLGGIAESGKVFRLEARNRCAATLGKQ